MIGISTEVLISMPPTLQQPTQPPCAKVSSLRRNCCSVTQLYLTFCNLMDSSMPGFPVLHYLPELAQTHVHWVGDAIQSSHPLPPPLLLPSIFPRIRVFSNELTLCIRWPKYWNFSFSISPSGLISFRMDWFDLIVQGTLKGSSPAPQFKSINPLVLSLLYGLSFTFIHDYWKNHSFDYMGFCQQSDVFAF